VGVADSVFKPCAGIGLLQNYKEGNLNDQGIKLEHDFLVWF
jgi:hypothetical protein